MQKAIIGKKIGMTQIFDEKGVFVPVTVIEAGPCVVTAKKTVENDGYASVQLGYGDLKGEPSAALQAEQVARLASPPAGGRG